MDRRTREWEREVSSALLRPPESALESAMPRGTPLPDCYKLDLIHLCTLSLAHLPHALLGLLATVHLSTSSLKSSISGVPQGRYWVVTIAPIP